jgi:hypothetical protein
MPLPRVGAHLAILDLRAGHRIVGVDAEDPEDSGPDDVEELIAPEAINFMESQGRGLSLPCHDAFTLHESSPQPPQHPPLPGCDAQIRQALCRTHWTSAT